MSARPQRREDPAEVWKNLFDFLEPRGRHSTHPNRGERDAGGRLEPGAPTRRQRAHAAYEQVFAKLTAYFDARGCGDAEDRAVETIVRVAERCHAYELEEGVEPMAVFYGFARRVVKEVYREWGREAELQRQHKLLPQDSPSEIREARDECLEECMAKLPGPERNIILDYYRGERGAKIAQRRQLAALLGKDLNALRIQTHRIRKKLRPCVSDCLEQRVERVVPQ